MPVVKLWNLAYCRAVRKCTEDLRVKGNDGCTLTRSLPSKGAPRPLRAPAPTPSPSPFASWSSPMSYSPSCPEWEYKQLCDLAQERYAREKKKDS